MHENSWHIEGTHKEFVVSEPASISTSLLEVPGSSLHIFPRIHLMVRHSLLGYRRSISHEGSTVVTKKDDLQ